MLATAYPAPSTGSLASSLVMASTLQPAFRPMNTTSAPTEIRIPDELKPADGRFGSGPSKVRPEAVEALARVSTTYLGTSHRQKTVRDQVARLRRGVAEPFGLPAGYEVVLSNGATTACWDPA